MSNLVQWVEGHCYTLSVSFQKEEEGNSWLLFTIAGFSQKKKLHHMPVCHNKHSCKSHALIQLSTTFKMYAGEKILDFFWRKSNFWYHWWHLNRIIHFCHSYGICMQRAQVNPEDKLLFFSSGMEISFSLILFLQTNAERMHKTNQSPSSILFFLGFFSFFFVLLAF